MMKGLAPQTSELFDAVTRLDCIKPFVLVGGTALSLQLNARQSSRLFLFRLPFVVTLGVNYCNTACCAVTTAVAGDDNRGG